MKNTNRGTNNANNAKTNTNNTAKGEITMKTTKTMTKVLALMLAAGMCVAALSGCAGSGLGDGTTGSTASTAATEATVAAEATAATTAPVAKTPVEATKPTATTPSTEATEAPTVAASEPVSGGSIHHDDDHEDHHGTSGGSGNSGSTGSSTSGGSTSGGSSSGSGSGSSAPAPTETKHTCAYTVKSVISPTCETRGYTVYACSCGESYQDDYTDALGHSYGDWLVTVAATTSAEGTETRTCTRCGATESRSIPKVEAPALDYAAAIAYGNAYGASTYGFIVDTSLNADNAGYNFASQASNASISRRADEWGWTPQEVLNRCMCNKVDALYADLVNRWGDVEGCRINCTIYDGADGTFWYNVYYG